MKGITAIMKYAAFLTLLPSIVCSEDLVAKEQSSLETAPVIDSYHSNRRLAVVGTVSEDLLLRKINKKHKKKRKVWLTNAGGEKMRIKNLRDHKVIATNGGCSTHHFRARKKGCKEIITYQASCCGEEGDTKQCMVHEGPTNVEPNPPGTWIQAFCTPEVVNCSLTVNACNPTDSTACPAPDETCTLTANTPQCEPPNSFACGLMGRNFLSCSHDDDCTGSDGKANQTACGENMKCLDDCGPVY
mmetsp:Transcript_26796/g.34935  ORF Transcript_26796/g.34935 Transcript_26796/m.34935 type:complete len:244 (-) Transcript_26796:41-772(-)